MGFELLECKVGLCIQPGAGCACDPVVGFKTTAVNLYPTLLTELIAVVV